ncbi:DUF2851 family protein [Candidatus Poribacteria bacterium]|nr:DUF2851 family protein [Candidatus Poribacteria bacterium]
MHALAHRLPEFPEDWLRRVWATPDLLRRPLRTVDGRSVRVLSQGAPNPGDGPDFLDATVEIGDQPQRGHVEFHRRTRDWYAHGHHRDARYDGVVLHVVLAHGERQSGVRRRDGARVPTIELRGLLALPMDRLAPALSEPIRDALCPLDPSRDPMSARVDRLLDMAVARFLRKAERFGQRAEVVGEDAVFYEGLADALGYSRNREPFALLVQRVPLDALLGSDPFDAEACLLGAAGLLPSQRGIVDDDRYVTDLEARWNRVAGRIAHPMRESDWHVSPVRRGNLPARRVVALGRITQAMGGGFVDELVRLGESASWRALSRAFRAADDDYWASHDDFGSPSRRRLRHLVGDARARDIVVNVGLPALVARAGVQRNADLRDRALALYGAHPSLMSNAKVDWVRRHVLDAEANTRLSGAAAQQGMLELYDTHCEPRRCAACPLAVRLAF